MLRGTKMDKIRYEQTDIVWTHTDRMKDNKYFKLVNIYW